MSYLVKLGAKEIAKDMIQEHEPGMERKNSKTWLAGFFAGLNEAGIITGDELDELTNWLSEL